MAAEVVLYEKKGKTAYITLNRPDKNNAINMEARKTLAGLWCEADTDPEVWSIILTGGDRVFSTGLDMAELAEFRKKELLGNMPYTGMDVFGAHVSKPVIAAVSGYCLGGGFLMTMVAADLRIASRTAKFGMPEVKIGITPGLGIPVMLTAHFPQNVALDMLLLGHNLSAEDAYRFGYVSRVVPPGELLAEAEAVAKEINDMSPLVVKNIKRVIRTVTAPDSKGVAFSNAVCLMSRYSEDYIEGPRAFREKRKPAWKGR
ncbi:MAG: putative enoyl-CoA hydratase echA8 [Smithella sp. PtaU1.Bin162]|nr:MAG: putative enoyl-CoA hydratase echA8 [Smithella sp. PtaU1.Bin162]